MEKVIFVNKPVGLTPLQAIKQFKQLNPEFTNIKMSYTGRLDPLAHGVLLLVYDGDLKDRGKYLALPKEYEFEVVLGLQTDSYDLLGLVKDVHIKQARKNVNLFVNTFVNNTLGKQLQAYPPYSSKTVKGKPLFWWAKNNKLQEITIPEREIEIFDFKCLEVGEMTLDELNKRVFKTISSVEGDFRQEEILKRWKQVFEKQENQNKTLVTAKFKISCSSGTYIRELVNKLGTKLGCGAIAIDILRTKIGEYSIKNAQKL